MKLVVTGAAGMVGQNLVPRLAARHQVTALDRNEHNLRLLAVRAPGARLELADLTGAGAWTRHLEGASAVIQLQAQIASQERAKFQAANVDSVEQVLEACRAARVPHLVHLSSSVVISVADDDYTRTKRAGEERVRQGRVPFTILRPPLMYGPFDAKHLGRLARLMRLAPVVPLPGGGRQVRQPLFVGDLCAVIESALARGPKDEVWNVIGHEKLPFVELLRGVARAQGWPRLFLPIPLGLVRAGVSVLQAVWPGVLFTTEQLDALVAGDEFPVDDWTTAFGVPYTPFARAIGEAWSAEGARHSYAMQPPH